MKQYTWHVINYFSHNKKWDNCNLPFNLAFLGVTPRDPLTRCVKPASRLWNSNISETYDMLPHFFTPTYSSCLELAIKHPFNGYINLTILSILSGHQWFTFSYKLHLFKWNNFINEPEWLDCFEYAWHYFVVYLKRRRFFLQPSLEHWYRLYYTR